MERTSDSYQFTVCMKDGAPTGACATRLQNLRRVISKSNSVSANKLYVKLQGRGHRQGKRAYWQSLPLRYAESADVYVYERR